MRLYFDFNDPNSLLLSFAIKGQAADINLPVEWVALDRDALRAQAGEPMVTRAELASRYYKKEVERRAKRLGYTLVWPQSKVNTGLLARSLQLAKQQLEAQVFVELVQQILEAIWLSGLSFNEQQLSGQLSALGLDAPLLLTEASRSESFLAIDNLIDEAIRAGVFEVPTFVVDGELFVGADSLDRAIEYERSLLLLELPHPKLAQSCAQLLSQVDSELRQSFMRGLPRAGEDNAALAPPSPPIKTINFEKHALAIRTLANPEERVRLPLSALSQPMQLRYKTCAATSAAELAASLSGLGLQQGIVLGPAAVDLSPKGLENRSTQAQGLEAHGGLIAATLHGHQEHTLHIPPSKRSLHLGLHPRAGFEDRFAAHLISNGRAALLMGADASDGLAQRYAASQGAHLLILMGLPEASPVPLAAAIRCQRWVLALGKHKLTLCAPDGSSAHIDADEAQLSLPWPPRFASPQPPAWSPAPPRTVLVHDEPIYLGAPDQRADLSLAVLGNGLSVVSASARSLLSANRRFETIRVSAGPICIVPLYEDAILVSEAVTHKMLSAISRAPKESRVLLVNYWSELSYDDLARLRPVWAATTAEWQSPVLTVIGTRPVELWESGQPDEAHRVEAESDRFPIDFAQQGNILQWQEELVGAQAQRLNLWLEVLNALVARH